MHASFNWHKVLLNIEKHMKQHMVQGSTSSQLPLLMDMHAAAVKDLGPQGKNDAIDDVVSFAQRMCLTSGV